MLFRSLCEAFEEGISLAREQHIPVLFHVEEVTQPQGHSTSGSHERYKSADRLEWEKNWDGLVKMKEWLLANGLASGIELEEIITQAREEAKACRDKAWKEYLEPLRQLANHAAGLIRQVATISAIQQELEQLANELETTRTPLRRDVLKIVYRAIQLCGQAQGMQPLQEFYQAIKLEGQRIYNTYL